MVQLRNRCGQPTASCPGSAERQSDTPNDAVAGRILARFSPAQPVPSTEQSQGCDQNHRSGSRGLRAQSSARKSPESAGKQQQMNSGLFALSILLFVAGITLMTLLN